MTTWEKIVETLPPFPDSKGEALGIWRCQDEIVCGAELMANAIADILDGVGYIAVTGFYDPEEDDRMGERDDLTGYYYVSV